MKLFSTLLLLAAAFCLKSVCASEESGDNAHSTSKEYVKFSPKCGAALASAAIAGAGAAHFLTPVGLCAAGFCPAGVAGGSLASLWQSTMPLIAKGGIFAQLQSLAMAGNGLGYITVTSGVLGGAVGATFLKDVCTFIDEADPDSAFGISLEMNYKAVMAAIQAGQSLESQCAASETCTAAKQAGASAVELAKEARASAVESAVQAGKNLEYQCAASETCTAAKQAGASAVYTVSSMWDNLKTGVSKKLTMLQLSSEKAWYERKRGEVVNKFGAEAYTSVQGLLKKQGWFEFWFEPHILSIGRDCGKKLRRLEEEAMKESSKGSRNRNLEEEEKGVFGICLLQEFQGIEMQNQPADVADIIQMYNEFSEQLNQIEKQINDVQQKIEQG